MWYVECLVEGEVCIHYFCLSGSLLIYQTLLICYRVKYFYNKKTEGLLGDSREVGLEVKACVCTSLYRLKNEVIV